MAYMQSTDDTNDDRAPLRSTFGIDMPKISTGRGGGSCCSNCKDRVCTPFGFIAAVLVGILAMSFATVVVSGKNGSSAVVLDSSLPSLVEILRKKFGGVAVSTKLSDFTPHVVAGGFMNVYTTSSAASGIYFEVEQKNMGPETLFVRSDLVVRSQGEDPMLHTQIDGNNPVWYFRLGENGQKVEIFEKQLNLRTSDKDLEPLLKEGAVDRWIAEFDIEWQFSSAVDEKYVFNAKDFVESVVFGVQMPAELTLHRLMKVSNYQRNINFFIESSVPATSQASDGDNADVDIGVLVSLALLPKQPMVGRQADPRIGYFSTGYVDLGEHPSRKDVRPSRRIDTNVRLINRWRLEKSSSCSNGLCEPVKPIVYYIDPSVPKRWQHYVAKGVLAWKPAFEKVGFLNTPRVVYPDDPNWPSDYSAGDIRYATISFAISRNYVFSVGPSVSDPRSGEILDADIGFAQEWVKAFTGEIGIQTIPKGSRRLGNKAEHDHHHHHHHINSKHNCGKMDAMMEARSLLALSFGQEPVPDDVLGNGLADVTTHEVGHTLGLRHNFKGSTSIPLDKLHDKTYTSQHGITASIMDYVAANIAVDPTKQGDFFPGANTIGGYDKLAIEYGYTVVPGEVQGVEDNALKAIAFLATKNFHFATDSDTDTQDPLARRYDLTNDPIGYSQTRFDLVNRLRPGIKARGALCGDGYACIYGLELSFLRKLFSSTRNAANFIGGRIIHHAFPALGTPPALPPTDTGPVTTVSSAYVKKALDMIAAFFHDQHYTPIPSADLAFMVQYKSDYDPTYPLFHADIIGQHEKYCKMIIDFVVNTRVVGNIQQSYYLAKSGAKSWSPTVSNGPTDTSPFTVYAVLSRLFEITWIGAANEHLCTQQDKWGIQRHVVKTIATLAYDETTSAPVQMQALQTLADVRGNATAMINDAHAGDDPVMLMYLQELVCETMFDKSECKSRGAK
jgi:hypothetical protein